MRSFLRCVLLHGDFINVVYYKNTGSDTLSNVRLQDLFAGASGDLVWENNSHSERFTLAEGESKTFKATYQVQEDDANKTLINTAIAHYAGGLDSDFVSTKIEKKKETVDVTGTKTWVDGGKTHNNAEELTLTLSRKSRFENESESVTATATWQGDTYTFSGLPKYDERDREYTYTVTEAAVSGYTTKQDGNNFTNTINTINDKIDVTGTKTWVDGGQKHDNADELTLTLSRTSKKAGSTAEEVKATATWEGNTYTFKDVAKYDKDGYEYTYSVAEAEVEGYTTKQEGNNFTNTVSTINDKIDVSGTKTWVDGGKTHNNAEELTLTLSRTNAKAGSVAEPVEATATWSGNTYTFSDLPKYDAEGYAYEYSVAEEKVEGYTTKQDGNNFTNTMDDINAKTSVTGTKTWVDGGLTHDNGTEVQLTLSRTANGKTEQVKATVTWSGNTYTFSNLDQYDAEGYEYTYSVAEAEVEGYTTKQEGNNFTNTMDGIDAKINVTGTKMWVDGGKEHDNATELTLTLSRTSEKAGREAETVEGVTATWEGNTYTFKDVAKYDAEGYEYTYTVAEGAVTGYTTKQEGNNFTNTVNTIHDTIEVTGTKTWVDGGKEHDNATELTLTLSRTSAKAGSAAEPVEATATWIGNTYTFNAVAKYDTEGYEYMYSVTEAAVEGYTTTSDGNNFTNTMDGIDAKTSVTGTKTWVDGGKEHNNAEELTLTLSRTSAKAGSTAETVEATAVWDGDTYKFEDVAKYDAEGYEYTYSVAEAHVDGYTVAYGGENSWDITNTIDDINATVEVTGTKTWVDGGRQHNNETEV